MGSYRASNTEEESKFVRKEGDREEERVQSVCKIQFEGRGKKRHVRNGKERDELRLFFSIPVAVRYTIHNSLTLYPNIPRVVLSFSFSTIGIYSFAI